MLVGMSTAKMKEIAVVKIQQHPTFIICANNNSSPASKAEVAHLSFFWPK